MQTITERTNRYNRSAMLQFPCYALALFLLQACQSLNIESARTLAEEGRNVAAAGSSQIFVSDMELRNAREAEVFMHAYAGAEKPDLILKYYKSIMLELSKRKTVFTNLADVYAIFYDLSSNDAPARIETAVNKLGDAVNDYSTTVSSTPFLSNESVTIAGAIGNASMTTEKKNMIMQSSVLIKERLHRLLKLLENPLVRQQLVTWKTNLAQNRAAVAQMLMNHGVLDTTPLLNQMGSDAGLQGAPDAADIIRKNTRLSNGLEQVIVYRM